MANIQQYLDNIPPHRLQSFLLIHQTIISVFPKITVDMFYKMPTYRYNKSWVALANQKRYISLYTCSIEHIKSFKEKYPHIKTGKGCINFKDSDDIPTTALKKVIRHAINQPKS